MKKIVTLLFLLVFITSCGTTPEVEKEKTENIETKNNDYTVGGKDFSNMHIYGNILSDNTKTLVSHINGTINNLNCELGQEVKAGTLIARVSPDSSDLNYKSNSIQISSLSEQFRNQQSIKTSTLQNFTTQKRQLVLQKNDLESKLTNLENNLKILKSQKGISNDDLSVKLDSVNEQIKNLEESKKLLEQNKTESVSDVSQNLENLKGQIYNTGNKAINRLDEIFGISNDNKDKDDKYEDYLGAKNNAGKSEIEAEIAQILAITSGDIKGYKDEELSDAIKNLSSTLKKAANIVKDSIPSLGSLSQQEIDGWYAELLGYSDGLLSYKTNFDKLKNATSTSALGFDAKIKELDIKLEELSSTKESLEKNTIKSTDLTYDSNINNLETQIDSAKTSLKNIDEQIKSLEDTKNTTVKQLDSQSTQLQDSISKTSVLLSSEDIYAGISGIVKEVKVKEGNFIKGGTPICVIVPKNDSLKLEIYSPESLELNLEFNYLKNGENMGTGTITSESPVVDIKTQNYTYEGNIDFSGFKAGDYVDIKVIKKVPSEQIWIPLKYVFPKLDGYYVNLKNEDKIELKKVEVGKMNNGEIEILSGLENGDILAL